MASVTAPYERIAEIIEEVDGYVIAANKNSPKMTVIAGETKPVKEAMSKFEAEGFQTVALATSHAFIRTSLQQTNLSADSRGSRDKLARDTDYEQCRWWMVPDG